MWASRPIWTGAKNFPPTGIRSPDSPARSESLCRLSFHGPPETGRAAAIVSKSGTADDGRSSSLLFGIVNNNSSPAYTQHLTKARQGLRPAINTSVSNGVTSAATMVTRYRVNFCRPSTARPTVCSSNRKRQTMCVR